MAIKPPTHKKSKTATRRIRIGARVHPAIMQIPQGNQRANWISRRGGSSSEGRVPTAGAFFDLSGKENALEAFLVSLSQDLQFKLPPSPALFVATDSRA
jgi:hypothetical protein